MRRVILVLTVMAAALVLGSGVAWAVNKIGTDGPDTLRGTNGADNLLGLGGNDKLFALAGKDNLQGGDGKDLVLGGNKRHPSGGDKNLFSGDGNDVVLGGKGSDNVLGGTGNDFLGDGEFRNPVKDNHSSGPGNDVLDVINLGSAGKDVVVCGSGFDRVLADRKDQVAPDCEKVFVGRGAIDDYFDSIPQSFFDGLPQF